jgi:hypothetical protein
MPLQFLPASCLKFILFLLSNVVAHCDHVFILPDTSANVKY